MLPKESSKNICNFNVPHKKVFGNRLSITLSYNPSTFKNII